MKASSVKAIPHIPARHTAIFVLLLGMVLAALAPGAASARPRDETLSTAFRCASIGDDHAWLDCYYGAAQPVRAALGLAPVPARQADLVANPPAGNPPVATMILRNRVMSQAVACPPQSDARAWLTCYYQAARPMRVHLGLESPPAAAPVQPLAPAQAAPPVPAITATARYPARMVSYTFNSLGYFTVTLANGEVWKQISGDTTFAHWKKKPENYLARVSHGWLGSRNLEVQGEPGLFRVQRLR